MRTLTPNGIGRPQSEVDQALSALLLAVLAILVPLVMARMLGGFGETVQGSADLWAPIFVAGATLTRDLAGIVLVLVTIACSWSAWEALRAPGERRTTRWVAAEIYAAAAIVAAAGRGYVM